MVGECCNLLEYPRAMFPQEFSFPAVNEQGEKCIRKDERLVSA